MGLFRKKTEIKLTEYASSMTYVEPRRKRIVNDVSYDNKPRYYVLRGEQWSPDNLTKLESHLRDNRIKYDSYPLKSGSWEIRYYGKNIGKWDGFEYARN